MKKIEDALNGAFKERTVIVVAHRLSTIHETLMKNKGHYHALVSSQMTVPEGIDVQLEKVEMQN